MKHKLGRIKSPALGVKGLKMAMCAEWHLNKLGSPPPRSTGWRNAVNALTGGDWLEEGNDTVGDCTCADQAHRKMLTTANAGTMVTPTSTDTLALYSAITGYTPTDPKTDQGADMQAVADYCLNTGFMGTKFDSYANLHPGNQDHIKWGIQLLSSVSIGVKLPNNAQAQFDAGDPWDTTFLPHFIEGGHDVILCDYDEQYFYCVTWGKIQAITPAWLKRYLDEAILPLDPDWINAVKCQSPSGFDLNALRADLAELKGD